MQKRLTAIRFVVGLIILGGVGSWIPTYATEQRWRLLVENIQQHPLDHRAYQAIQLNNGMKVLLVSDPKAPYSMTAVGLPVGSLQDPVVYAGLVHYLEHLLFLGSENYPEGIEMHGHNAGTGANSTIFTATTQHPWLAVTLERLADALANPNFDPQLAEKERQAVDQEAIGYRTEDSWRIYQINKETLNPQHPFSRFSVGNLQTLVDKKEGSLQQAVKDFHQKYYSANIMVAVIYSNQPLAALAHLAAESYGRISHHKTVIQPIAMPLATARQQGVMIHYVPAKVYEALQVDFVIPADNRDSLHSKTNYYLNRLITGRGPGTLADWLQQQGWVNEVSVSYNSDMAGNAGLFSIHLHPTEVGMAKQDHILAALFRYLDLIKQQGVKYEYFKEMSQQLKIQSFDLATQCDLDYVKLLTDNLLKFPVQQLLIANFLADDYHPTYVQRRLSQMVPQQARIWIASPQAVHDRQAYYMNAPYQIKPLSQQQILHWKQLGEKLTFDLPQLNSYLPTDFTVVPVKTRSEKPQLIWKVSGGRAWLTPSHHFPEQPQVNITLMLRNPQAVNGLRNGVLSWVFRYLLSLHLRQFFYWAEDAGAIIKITYNDKGLVIFAEGFRQNLPGLLEKLIINCQQIIFNQSQLDQVKYEIKQCLASTANESACQQAMRVIDELDEVGCGSIDQQRAQLDNITLQDIDAYRHQLMSKATMDIIAVGNIGKMQLCHFANKLHKKIAIKQQKHVENKNIKINQIEKVLLKQDAIVDGHALRALYIPRGYDALSSKANAYLLSRLLETWFFDQIRTQEQLGYTVDVSPYSLGGRTGLLFTVQSSTHSPQELYLRYQDFYQQAWLQLQKLKEKREFCAYQRDLLESLQKKPASLWGEARVWSNDLINEQFEFGGKSPLIARVKALTAEEVLRFYQEAILEPTGLALLSQVRGKTVKNSQSTEGNAAAFATPQGWKSYSSVLALQQKLITNG